jgi:Recombination endonuclease VII
MAKRKTARLPRVCACGCGKEFVPVKSQVYASVACRDRGHAARAPRETCRRCGNPRGDSSHPQYCRDCKRRYERESRERRKAAGMLVMQERCSRCGRERTGRHPAYCQECWRGPLRAARFLEPCSRCGQMRDPADRTHANYCYSCYRDLYLRRQFGITAEQFDVMLAAQNGGCAICGGPLDRGGVTGLNGNMSGHVDHDHGCCPGKRSCGRCVRGILCGCCNRAIGQLGDDPVMLRRAANYIEETRGGGDAAGGAVPG